MYGALKGCQLAKLVAHFKIRNYTGENAVRWVAAVRILSAVNSGFLSDIHGLVTVQMREDSGKFTIVEVGTILGLAHLIPEEKRCWLVDSLIDLSTFNEPYQGIGYKGIGAWCEYPSTRAGLLWRKTPSGEVWGGSLINFTTIRQTAFCRHKHMIVKLDMYIEAIV